MQFDAYCNGDEPFNHSQKPNQSICEYWDRLLGDENADVLAALTIKIFSVIPVSMADEHAMSVITWLNGPKHKSQTAKQNVKKPLHVKWHDICSTIEKSMITTAEAQENDKPDEVSASDGPIPQDPANNVLRWLDDKLPNELNIQNHEYFALAAQFDISRFHDILDEDSIKDKVLRAGPMTVCDASSASFAESSLASQTVLSVEDWLSI
ncbi:hypothetical protein BDQ17DRAFT_1426878 [Cyathus striatus]|nr:hypothetical protein BDQ17DRAFT_1426878 [Cyathus striatus]